MASIDPVEPEPPVPPSRLRRWTLPLVFGIAVAVLGGVALALRAAGSTAPPAGAAGQSTQSRGLYAYACAGPRDALSFCDFLAQQLASRSHLSAADYRSASRTALDVSRVVHGSGARTGPRQVEQALLAAGYPGAVARFARSGDPVPPGAILYAVPVANACVIGYVKGRTDGDSQGVVGTLPDGTCLPP